MNRSSKPTAEDEMRDEYDFSGAVRGKYLDQYRQGANVAVLDPDVAAVFRDSESVNQALRLLLSVAQEQGHGADSLGTEVIEALRRQLGRAARSRR